MKDLIKSFLSFGLATSIDRLLGLILLPIYTSCFNKVEYGVIDMVAVILGIATIFGVLQIETSLQRYYYESKELRKKLLISNVFIFILAASVLVAAIMYLLAPYLAVSLLENKHYEELIRLAAFQLPLINISMQGLVVLRYERENLKFLLIIIIKLILSLLFVYIFVIFQKLELYGVFLAQLSSLLFSTILVLIFTRKYFVLYYSKEVIRKTTRYAFPQIPARIGSVLLSQANRFFMLSFLSLGAIGLYAVSLKLASGVQMFYSAFVMAWGPFMFDQFKKKNNKKVFASVLPIISSLIFAVVGVITLFSQEIFRLMVSKDFYDGHKFIGGLSLYFALFIIKEVVDIGPKFKEKTKFLSYTFLVSLLVNLGSLYILIQFYGLEGVVISMIVTNVFLVILSWLVSNYLYPISFNKIYFVLLLLPVLLLSIVSMYIEFGFITRIGLTFLLLLIYSSSMYLSIKKYKNIVITE